MLTFFHLYHFNHFSHFQPKAVLPLLPWLAPGMAPGGVARGEAGSVLGRNGRYVGGH